MHIKNKRGQSTVEYVLLVTAVVAVMIVFATNKNAGFQSQLCSTLNTATSDIGTVMTQLDGSHKAGPGCKGDKCNAPYSVNVAKGL